MIKHWSVLTARNVSKALGFGLGRRASRAQRSTLSLSLSLSLSRLAPHRINPKPVRAGWLGSRIAATVSLVGLLTLTYLIISPLSFIPTPNANAAPANPLKTTSTPSLSLSANKTAIALHLSPNNFGSDNFTITTTTENPTGYTTSISTNSPTETCLIRPSDITNSKTCSTAANTITSVSGSVDSAGTITPSTLLANQWGVSVASSFSSNPSQDNVWFKIPDNSTPSIVKSSPTATSVSGETQTVTVGAKVDFSLPATTTGDEYQNTIVVTAVANDVSFLAPYIDLIIPASDYYTGGATIGIKGTNLDTAYQVFIDLNGDGEQDSDEECINANIESSILITCDVQAVDKSYASISTMYPVVVKTWGGTYTKTIGFKYVFPPATVTGISPDNSPVLTSTPVTIYGTGFTGGSGVDYVNFTFADDTHQECTNITVISDTELTCITPPSVVAGAAKFFVHVNLVAGGGNSDTNGVYFTYTAPTCRNADPTSVCVADLDPAMIPVKYTGTTSVPEWQIADPDTAGDWYDYNQKQWANAVTVKASGTQTRQNYLDAAAGTVVDPADVLSYYVYIPRYRYKIWTTTWRATNYPTAITIGFENCASDGNTCQTADYDKAEVSEVVAKLPNPLGTPLTHPAFTFNDHELNGIWVGKYESTNTAAVPRALPNIAQLSNVTIGAMFNGAKNAVATSNEQGLAATETDTRILNSDDWGAIAYLSQSIYGVCTNANCSVSGNPITTISPALSETQKIWNNGVSTCGGGGGRTGYGSGGKSDGCSGNVYNANNIWYSANGMLASSNHNSTGIYDLAGGVWEYTLDVYNMDLNSAASDISVFDAKYMNSYTNPPLTNSANDIFNGNYNLTSTFTAALGQAVFEVGGTASLTGAWNGDHSRSATSSNPWSDHGGQGTNETPAGLFAAGSAGGGGDLGIGSRLLLSRP